MRVVSNEVFVLLDHESAAHIRSSAVGLKTSIHLASSMRPLRFMVKHFVVHMVFVHASGLLHSSKCHFVKRDKFAWPLAIPWTRWE